MKGWSLGQRQGESSGYESLPLLETTCCLFSFLFYYYVFLPLVGFKEMFFLFVFFFFPSPLLVLKGKLSLLVFFSRGLHEMDVDGYGGHRCQWHLRFSPRQLEALGSRPQKTHWGGSERLQARVPQGLPGLCHLSLFFGLGITCFVLVAFFGVCFAGFRFDHAELRNSGELILVRRGHCP